MLSESQVRDIATVFERWSVAPRGLYTVRDRGSNGLEIIEILPDRGPRLIATMNSGLGRESGIAIASLFAHASPSLEVLLNTVAPVLIRSRPV